jgi:cysteinyl-tRNA synthetase
MLRLFNSYSKKVEKFRPVNKKLVTIFTCGPSVYQRSHIGNLRTFLFEDVLVRYLEYSGYKVKRGMNFTDLEDKAIREALNKNMTMRDLTRANMKSFISEMKLLRMKAPDYLPVASEHVDEMALIIGQLVSEGHAYWYEGNVYYDPLTFDGFGKLYGLDMSSWPEKKKRFHQDTYPGIQWNRGDFILWHGYRPGDPFFRETPVGKGRPSWNVQDPALVSLHFDETLSIYCGGIDNLFRHHDYSISILESVKPYPMARFWLHCHHLVVRGQKMSKSRGNIYYTDTLSKLGYTAEEIRFFLIYGHYRKQLSYSDRAMQRVAERLRDLRKIVKGIQKRAGRGHREDSAVSKTLLRMFTSHMDNDLDVKTAFNDLHRALTDIDTDRLTKETAAGTIAVLKKIDSVLQVLF